MGTVDVIIHGTGFPQAVLAHELSKHGQTVLLIDDRDYYGQHDSRLCVADLDLFDSKFSFCALGSREPRRIKDFEDFCIKINRLDCHEKTIVVDLDPIQMYSKDKLVELLKQSGVSEYLDIRLLEHSGIYRNGKFDLVPLSKNQIFRSTCLDNVEKRQLTKILSSVGMQNTRINFHAWMEQQDLSSQLQDIVNHVVCRFPRQEHPAETLLGEVQERIALFMQSVGVYGDSPYLFPRHGRDDIIQGFVRKAAVQGAITMLGARINQIQTTDQGFDLTLQDHMVWHSRYLVTNSETLRPRSLQDSILMHNIVLITLFPLYPTNEAVHLVIPPLSLENPSVIDIVQIGHHSSDCPPNHYIIHMSICGGTSESLDNAALRLVPDLERIVLWMSYSRLYDEIPLVRDNRLFGLTRFIVANNPLAKDTHAIDHQVVPVLRSICPELY